MSHMIKLYHLVWVIPSAALVGMWLAALLRANDDEDDK